MNKKDLSRDELRKRLHYNPETGVFTRLKIDGEKQPRLIGKRAGSVNSSGYIDISISGGRYYGHRLAFLYMVGNIPGNCDHINRVRHDNRWINLRKATTSQNMANSELRSSNTSGYKGVSWNKKSGKWRSQISVKGRRVEVGSFDCEHHAFVEYVLASRSIFGVFSPF